MKLTPTRGMGAFVLLVLVGCLLSGCGKIEEKNSVAMAKNSNTGPKKLNLGCADDIRDGYDNIDLYYNHPKIIKMDIRKLTYADNTVDEILASHVLEHLPFQDVPVAINEMYRVLKPGGRVIIDVPDLEAAVKMWLEQSEEERWGAAFVGIYGSQERDGNFHKTGFTKARLRKVLMDKPFKSVEVKGIISHGGPSLYGEAIK